MTMRIEEQDRVLENDKSMMLVSASAGSGKTYVMMRYITNLVCEKRVPVQELLVLTFTKAAALQMKTKLLENLQNELKSNISDKEKFDFISQQIDAVSTSNISTIHSFCEKCLKKYANLLNLSENFTLLDEGNSSVVRDRAFENAFKIFERDHVEAFEELSSSFKNDRTVIKNILAEIESLANSVADKQNFLEDNFNNAEMLFDDAINFLFSHTKRIVLKNIEEVEKLHLGNYEETLKEKLANVLQSQNLFELALNIQDFKFPTKPSYKLIGQQASDQLEKIKQNIVDIFTKIKALELDNAEKVNFQRFGGFEKILLQLFLLYEKESEFLKRKQNCLDFFDLEKYMKVLSEKENLFDGLKFVFIDEYQDTNKIQERIIKNVAKNSKLVAVGDVKQGIYGFRLASSEIFLKDMKDFQEMEDGQVNFLKSNFRSSQRVLDFINNVFKVCMTDELTGIDYEKTSMLLQADQARFEGDDEKAVNIDLIAEAVEGTCELPEIYSVKNSEVFKDEKNVLILKDIKNRIVEVTSSKIVENGVKRNVRFGDIAILSRDRSPLFNLLETYLQENNVPVFSNSRNTLLSQPEVLMLLSYLKLVLCLDDDVAVLSVLSSGLYNISVQQVLKLKEETNLSLCEMAKSQSLFAQFYSDLTLFKNSYSIVGIKSAFCQLFAKRNYKAFLTINQPQAILFVDKFLQEVEKFDFDLPEAIHYLETVKIIVTPEISNAEDSVLLTTIHNSKGLEYPIVFLIGCDQSISKSKDKFGVEINENFGLAVKMYDKENNKQNQSVRMCAIKESEIEKNFVEELMIFYVALTRAKNRLYLFGQEPKTLNKFNVANCDTYFDFIFLALQKQVQKYLIDKHYEDENLEIRFVEDVQEIEFGTKQNLENAQISQEFKEKIERYLDFEYKLDDKLNFKLKESVTSLNNKNVENVLSKFSNENINFSNNVLDVGNAYHFALKALDFEKVQDLKTLQNEVEKNKKFFDEKLIDSEILLNNILILKKFTKNAKIYKEKEFIMKEKVCDILQSNVEDEILIQGVVDLFIEKNDEIILIDYKYSNNLDEKYLIEKYKNQLKLYKIAIENALKKKISGIYLLSLKNSNLIKVEIN